MRRKLEVCVDSAESAVIAQEAGADCLEVCSNLVIGGTTPDVNQFKQIRRLCGIGLSVLIRPRYGDFLYTDTEFQMIKEDICLFRELGADGITVGCLLPDGSLDVDRMKEIRERAASMQLTLHRAFDVCRDPYKALEEAVMLGVDRILTSGQASVCTEGADVLKKLVMQAGDRIEILVGSGVNDEVICSLAETVQPAGFHMSGKKNIGSGMLYRKKDVNMGIPGFGEFDLLRTDKEAVRRARQVLDEML